MEESYEELQELVKNIVEDYGVTIKEAFDIALKIQANEIAVSNNHALTKAIADLDQTFAIAFNPENDKSSTFASLAQSMDRIATIAEIQD